VVDVSAHGRGSVRDDLSKPFYDSMIQSPGFGSAESSCTFAEVPIWCFKSLSHCRLSPYFQQVQNSQPDLVLPSQTKSRTEQSVYTTGEPGFGTLKVLSNAKNLQGVLMQIAEVLFSEKTARGEFCAEA